MPTRACTWPALAGNVRYNSHELVKLLGEDERPGASFDLGAANAIKFRRYWDAELQASVYLNEFLTGHAKWLDDLYDELDPKWRKLQETKAEQLDGILEVSDEREERFAEIIDQHDADGMIKYWLGMLMIDPSSAPATYLLIRVARRVGEVVVMCLKEEFGEARPSQVFPAVIPMIDPPITPSFPAGHALQAYLISQCLQAAKWARQRPGLLDGLAKRIADNRVIAGLHYDLDNEAGKLAAAKCFALLGNGEKFRRLLDGAQRESEPVQPGPHNGARQVVQRRTDQ